LANSSRFGCKKGRGHNIHYPSTCGVCETVGREELGGWPKNDDAGKKIVL